ACTLATLSAASTIANIDTRITVAVRRRRAGDMKGFAGRDASAVVLNCSNVWAQPSTERVCCGGKFACHSPPRRGIQQTPAFSPRDGPPEPREYAMNVVAA